MKLGDRVTLRYHFSIVGYNFEAGIIELQLFNKDMSAIEKIDVPLYLPSLGLKVNQKFVKPSDNLPRDHPDYYEREERWAIINNEPCEILLSPNFDCNGLYTIKPIGDHRLPRKKVAQYFDSIYLDYILRDMEDEIMPGSNISGTIVLIFDRDGDIYDEVVENSIVLVEQDNGNTLVIKPKFIID